MDFTINGEEYIRGLPAQEHLRGIIKFDANMGNEGDEQVFAQMNIQLATMKVEFGQMLNNQEWVTLATLGEAKLLEVLIKEFNLGPPRCYVDSKDSQVKKLAERICKQVVTEKHYKVRGFIK